MQPTFTFRTTSFSGFKFLALAFIFTLFTQFSFSQQKGVGKQTTVYSDNDAGLPNQQIIPIVRREILQIQKQSVLQSMAPYRLVILRLM